MKHTFGEIIRKYRRERDLTQDELAQDIGISSQSVSKWERGDGYPDIMLLPVIARYFGVTIDELLGNDKTDEIIDGYVKESDNYLHKGETEKNLALWEKAYAEFPEDLRVMENLMCSINGKGIYPVPKKEAESIISLGEKILARSTDQTQRETVIHQLCFVYSGMGNREKALYYADMGGDLWTTRANLRLFALSGEDAVKEDQQYLLDLIFHTAMKVMSIQANMDYSPKDDIEAYQFAADIIERLFSDGNVGPFSFDLSRYYYRIAASYARMNDGENTVKALGRSRDYAVINATLPEKINYTAPLVNRLKYNKAGTGKNFKGNSCNIRLDELKNSCFDFIRGDDSFKEIVADLEKYAEKI